MEAIKAIQEAKDPQEPQTFLGITTYMAPFIPNLFAMSEPLRNLLKKDTDFHWSLSHSTALENMKQSICRGVSLTYFDPKKETVVQVDASLRGFGSALVQQGKVQSSYSMQTLSARCLLLQVPLAPVRQEVCSGVRSQTP